MSNKITLFPERFTPTMEIALGTTGPPSLKFDNELHKIMCAVGMTFDESMLVAAELYLRLCLCNLCAYSMGQSAMPVDSEKSGAAIREKLRAAVNKIIEQEFPVNHE